MEVNSFVQLYTTLFGWHFYELIWAILVGTGIVFIPILGILFDAFMRSRESGSVFRADPESALATVEVRLFVMMVVILLAAVPTGLTTLTGSTLEHGAATVEDTGTMFDEDRSFGGSPIVDAVSVEIPAWWYLVMSVSQGITNAVIEAAGDTASFRDLRVAIGAAAIRDPYTRYLTQVMYNDCFIPARTRYFSEQEHASDTFGDDVHWIGSEVLANTYYDDLHTRQILKGYAYSQATMPEFVSDPGLGGRPTCAALWGDIEEDILDQARADGVYSVINEVYGDLLGVEKSAQIIRAYVTAEHIPALSTPDEINSLRTQGDGWIAKITSWATGLSTAGGLGEMVVFLSGAASALIYAATYIQAYALMAIYLYIPMGLLLSGFGLRYLIEAGLLIFSVIFWSALWTISAQADNFIGAALFGDGFEFGVRAAIQDPDLMIKELTHSVVVILLYTLLPAATTWVLTSAGSRVAHYASSSLSGPASYVNAAQYGRNGGRLVRGYQSVSGYLTGSNKK